MSRTRVGVISPKSHTAANPFKACQNWNNDSLCCWCLEKDRCPSSVLFLFFRKQSVHKVISPWAFKSHNAVCGYVSINCFLACSPSDKYRMLITFLFAGFSSRSPRRARTLGFCWFASRDNSVTELGYLVIKATWNRSNHLSQSIGGFATPAVRQGVTMKLTRKTPCWRWTQWSRKQLRDECKLMNDEFRIVNCFVLLWLHAMKLDKLKV